MAEPIAIYPGSFDPLTDAHLGIIQRAARLFPRLIVAVVYNPNKVTLFTLEERLHFIRESVAPLGSVEVDSSTGELLVDYARRVGATLVVRGLRNRRDVRSEFQQSTMNGRMFPALETIFFFADPEESYLSSTLVRQTLRGGGDASSFVPDVVTRR